MSVDTNRALEHMQILVVDDNEVNTMVVASMLEQYNMQVTEVYAGKDAIEEAKYKDFDIIFMDYLMPEMNGIETTEEIRKLGKTKRPVIVILSANDKEDLWQQCKKAGVDDVLKKPLEMEKLQNIIEKWMPDHQLDGVSTMEAQDAQVADIVKIFQEVEGLDVIKGLSHMANSVDHYIKVIEAAVDNIRTERKLLEMYVQSQLQASSLKNAFHSLKGVFLNLGATQLAQRSQVFELECMRLSMGELREELQCYLEEMDTFLNGLEVGLQTYGTDYIGDQSNRYMPITEKEREEYIALLRENLKNYVYNDLHMLVDKLLYASQGEVRTYYQEIDRAVQNFQYEEALSILEENILDAV
ncbi:MAG: response regulator [Lachnospiraceae bacterium]|nr:response regulator [Lachnospiraceae bacterium]